MLCLAFFIFYIRSLFINQKTIIFLIDIYTLYFRAIVHNLRMKYIDSKKLSETQFKRYTGISWSTFDLMVEQLKMHIPVKGRPSKLSVEDQVLLCLSYWREYRTLSMSQQVMACQSLLLQESFAM